MMKRWSSVRIGRYLTLAWLGVCPLAAPANPGQPAAPPSDSGATHATPLGAAATEAQARNWHMRAGELIKRTWGVDVLGVRLANSEWMLTFRYRVLDPAKAKVLLDPKSTAYLVDEASGARLAVPALENIGELRQTRKPEADRDYFVMFGNANRIVRRGSRVDVVVGDFHADGLIVE